MNIYNQLLKYLPLKMHNNNIKASRIILY